ncbi:putative disease resistance response protein-like [Capsicum annuum]|nr:putative disease resistance response protein-like [Capsicum annuum]
MSYVQACVKETLRLHPPAPLLLPHRAIESCQVMSYTIHKDAQILVNVWAITRDPLIWEEPEMFRPYRFLSSDCLISFGVGKSNLYSSIIRIPNCIGLIISKSMTPKEKTSDFSVDFPVRAYSGAKYLQNYHKSTSQDQNQQPGPKDGSFIGALVEKVEDLVSGLFLPLYFVSSGLKTNVATIQGAQSWGLLVLVIVTACFGKIVGTIVVSLLCKLPVQEAVTIGFLMNTKGLVELIVLNIGKDGGVLNDQTFAIMVLMALFTTFITTPIVISVYKPAKLAVTASRNIPGMLNVIEVSRRIEKRERLRVYAMHLMELSESMHEDIVASAERERVAMIILLFHKHPRLDGHLETTRTGLRRVNRRVLQHAPCSIGILVDRGFGGASHVSSSNVDFSVTALFFGGHDDREALAYGVRIAEHPGISLVVVQFIVDPEVNGTSVKMEMNNSSIPEVQSDDEEFLADVKQKSSIDGSIKYEERIVKDA